MLKSISLRQLREWYEFDKEVMFEDKLQTFMLGQISAAVYNAGFRPKEHFSPSDFYPDTYTVKEPVKTQSVEQQIAIWRSLSGRKN